MGAAIGSGSFAVLRWGYSWLRGRDGLGLGDVKVMAGLGAYAGPYDVAMLVLIAAGAALAVTLVHHWLRDLRRARPPHSAVAAPPTPVSRLPAASLALPFGAALCGAGGAIWLARAASALVLQSNY